MSKPNSFRDSSYCGKCKHCDDCCAEISRGFKCLKHNFLIEADPYEHVCNDYEEGNPDEEDS